jgi:hypothetical protein
MIGKHLRDFANQLLPSFSVTVQPQGAGREDEISDVEPPNGIVAKEAASQLRCRVRDASKGSAIEAESVTCQVAAMLSGTT